MDNSINLAYGKRLAEIAEIEPAFAFDALRTGLTAVFTRQSYNHLVQMKQPEDPDAELKKVADSHRKLDGETAFTGTVAHAMDGLVDTLLSRYQASEADFIVSIMRKPGIIGWLRGQKPTAEVVAVIPFVADPAV